MPRLDPLLRFLMSLCLSTAWLPASDVPAPAIDFYRDIAPIFRATCYTCHGPDKQEGKLRMDSRAALLKGGEDGPGLVVGDGAKSAIVMRSLGQGMKWSAPGSSTLWYSSSSAPPSRAYW